MIADVTIRQEAYGDHLDVFALNRTVFERDDEAMLVDTLRKNKKVFIPELSIVAILKNKVVGHILFTKINIKAADGTLNESLALAPMAVKSELQNKGIGGQLIRKGLDIATGLGYKSVIVLGHERYYPRFGFEPADKWNISAPFAVPSHAFMGIELVCDGLKDISSTVIYPKEFEIV